MKKLNLVFLSIMVALAIGLFTSYSFGQDVPAPTITSISEVELDKQIATGDTSLLERRDQMEFAISTFITETIEKFEADSGKDVTGLQVNHVNHYRSPTGINVFSINTIIQIDTALRR